MPMLVPDKRLTQTHMRERGGRGHGHGGQYRSKKGKREFSGMDVVWIYEVGHGTDQHVVQKLSKAMPYDKPGKRWKDITDIKDVLPIYSKNLALKNC